MSPEDQMLVAKLEEALERGGGTHNFMRDIVPHLAQGTGRYQLWHRNGGAIVTELIDFPNFRVVNYFLVAGELPSVLAMQPEIDAWARTNGATRAVADGRLGWKRALEPYGWKQRSVGLYRDLRS